MIEILYKDLDPDTGKTVLEKRVCLCESEQMANLVFYALNEVHRQDENPNRELYMKNWTK